MSSRHSPCQACYGARISGLLALVALGTWLSVLACGQRTVETPALPPQLAQAQALAAAHQYRQAEKAYEEAALNAPDSPLAYSGLGNLYASLGYLEKAVAAYKQALAIDSTHIDTRHNLAVVYADLGRFPQAFALLDPLTQNHAHYAPAHLTRALLLLKQGRYKQAETALLSGVRTAPEQADFHRHLGQLYTRQGDYHKAEAALQTAASLAPDAAETWRLQGLLYMDWERYPQALAMLEKTLALDPTHVEAHINLAHALRALGRQQEANAALEHFKALSANATHIAQQRRALDADPEDTEARMVLAAHYLQLERPTQAAVHYHAVLATDPDHLEARVQLANLYLTWGKAAEALALCEPILDQKPQASQYYKLYFIAGYIYLADHRLDRAEAAFARTLELKPDYIEAWNNMGNLQILKNRPLAARRAFEKALKLDPGFAAAHFNLARLYDRQNAFPQARHHYLATLRADSTYAAAYFALGSLYEKQDSTRAALQQFRRFIECGTADSVQIATARQRITRLEASL